MEIAWAAAAGADREIARQVRFGAGRKSGDLLVADMEPFDLTLASDGVGQPVQAIPDDAIDPLHARRGKVSANCSATVLAIFFSSQSRNTTSCRA